jgi:hypothetical protein
LNSIITRSPPKSSPANVRQADRSAKFATEPSKLDPDKQATFIKSYENLPNYIGDDEAVLFGDAVHPTHAVRLVECWAPKDTPLAVPQTSGRQRLNIHGAIDLETGKTRMTTGVPDQAPLHLRLLPASGSDRATLGPDAQACHPQPMS